MKKLFSILFAAMILLSGMHLSLATHLCGGEISAVKLSFAIDRVFCLASKWLLTSAFVYTLDELAFNASAEDA